MSLSSFIYCERFVSRKGRTHKLLCSSDVSFSDLPEANGHVSLLLQPRYQCVKTLNNFAILYAMIVVTQGPIIALPFPDRIVQALLHILGIDHDDNFFISTVPFADFHGLNLDKGREHAFEQSCVACVLVVGRQYFRDIAGTVGSKVHPIRCDCV